MTSPTKSDEIFARNATYEIGLYARQPLAIARGQGSTLWDVDGKRYLDFFAGVAVNSVVTGEAQSSSLALAPELDLFGFSIGTGLTW